MIRPLIVMGLAALSFQVVAQCAQDDAVGNWLLKYQYRHPDQVGQCLISEDSEGVLSGDCENLTFGLSSGIFDGQIFIKKNCSVRGFLYTTEGQFVKITSGTFNRKKQRGSGVIKVSYNGFIAKGTYRMWRQ